MDLPAPMKAQTADTPFSRSGWGFELKYDGVRAIIGIDNGVVRIAGSSGRDETVRYPEAAVLAEVAAGRTLVVDAEIVVLDEMGRPSFQRLQPRIAAQRERDVAARRHEAPATIAVFDLLRDGDTDTMQWPLTRRRERLREILATPTPGVIVVDHVDTDGEELFRALEKTGVEGMMAKRLDSPYRPGVRSPDWIKVKAWQSQTCAIAGWTAGQGSRARLGALVLAVRDGSGWRYAGNVGSGFTERAVDDLLALLTPLVRTSPAIDNAPPAAGVTWTDPVLLCEVRHAGMNDSGSLRHPVFHGLRSDGDPVAPAAPRRRQAPPVVAADDAPAAIMAIKGNTGDVVIDDRPVHLTNLDKELWPGIAKRRMIAHYVAMAPLLLPHLHDRAVGSQVFPDGIDGKSFWRKRVPDHAPDWLRRWTFSGDRTTVTYAVPDSAASLAWLANAGGIDIHPWHSRIDEPEQPDWAVFDLDPSEGATFEDVVIIARLVHVALDHLGMRGYLKTSGQTGLQIYVPITRGPSFAAVRNWVEAVSRAVGRVVPDKISWEWTVSKRDGRVRMDYTQNVRNKTLASPYSLRPAPGGPVSTPLAWEELDDPALRPGAWTIDTIGERIARTGDLFAAVLDGGQDLPESAPQKA